MIRKITWPDRATLLYGLCLALLLFALRWFELRFAIMRNSVEVYIGFVALLFTGLGVWLSLKLMKPKTVVVEKEILVPQPAEFVRNASEIERSGLSSRELEVLEAMSAGMSNQEIADKLFLSVNTIKTHCSNILVKLDVKRRTQAVEKARRQRMIP